MLLIALFKHSPLFRAVHDVSAVRDILYILLFDSNSARSCRKSVVRVLFNVIMNLWESVEKMEFFYCTNVLGVKKRYVMYLVEVQEKERENIIRISSNFNCLSKKEDRGSTRD